MMKKKTYTPADSRLRAALSFARVGRIPADIGTDHAYIPIELLLSGRAPRALATDVNEGPLDRARINARRYGVAERMRFCLADGLQNVPLEEEKAADLYFCGMGGELIASLVLASAYPRRPDVRLILQPMTCAGELRSSLCAAGFRIAEELLAADGTRLYQCLTAEYAGEGQVLSPGEAQLGPRILARGARDPLFAPHLRRVAALTRQRLEGRRAGGLDVSADEELLGELQSIAGKEQIVL